MSTICSIASTTPVPIASCGWHRERRVVPASSCITSSRGGDHAQPPSSTKSADRYHRRAAWHSHGADAGRSRARVLLCPPSRSRPDGARQYAASAVLYPHGGAFLCAGVRLSDRAVGLAVCPSCQRTAGCQRLFAQAGAAAGTAGADAGELCLVRPVAACHLLPTGD